MLKMLNKNKNKSKAGLFSILMLTASFAQAQEFDNFVERIGDTGTGFGEIIAIICWVVAGVLLMIAGFNMYKKSKNPNGNEGSIILGALIAGVVLLAIPQIAGIGVDGLFGNNDGDSSNLRFGE